MFPYRAKCFHTVPRARMETFASGDIMKCAPAVRRPFEPPHDRLRLAACQPADFRRAGSRRKGRIEYVDIEAHVDRGPADHLADLTSGLGMS